MLVPRVPEIIRPPPLIFPSFPAPAIIRAAPIIGGVRARPRAADGVIFLGRKTATAVGSASTGVTLDLTTLGGGDLGANPTLQENDFVLVYNAVASDVDINNTMTTSGYTQRFEGYQPDNISSNVAAFYKFMGATPDTTAVTGPSTNANYAQAGQAWVFRGIDQTTPFDVGDTGSSQANTVLWNPPSITPVTDGSILLWGACGGHGAGTQTWSEPGTGVDLEAFLSAGRDDVYDVTIGGGFYRWASGDGAINPNAWTFSFSDSASYSCRGAAHALRPA